MALVALGENLHQAHRASEAFMRHDEAVLRDSAVYRNDAHQLISLAEIRRADLAALLKRTGQADGDADNSTRW